MHTKICSATTIGIRSYAVDVEVDLSFGLMNFFIVGLPDTAIKESRDRVRIAFKNSGLRLPQRKITVNLAPASLKKEGTLFDLPIAIGLLQASGAVELSQKFINETVFLGELALNGDIRRVKGVLPIAHDMQRLGKKRLIIPKENAKEAALIEEVEVIGVQNITELVGYLRSEILIPRAESSFAFLKDNQSKKSEIDFAQVKGQEQAKRALQISAAGWHNILFVGSPGSGKTMLAQRLATIMPKMSFEEVVETSKVYSVSIKAGGDSLKTERPFRSPHHTISQAGLIGGGSNPQPGEISLAHKGVLFLDELTEFKQPVLEALRQPLEGKGVTICRASHTVEYPANFLLVAALNPCPCGYFGDKRKECSCSDLVIKRYLAKLSGPLLDRIDIQVPVYSVDYDTISDKQTKPMSSKQMYEGVQVALQKQQQRFGKADRWNSNMKADEVEKFCALTDEAKELIKKMFDVLGLSMRGYHKILKVSRTIADLEGQDLITGTHLREAMMYRSLDQNLEQM